MTDRERIYLSGDKTLNNFFRLLKGLHTVGALYSKRHQNETRTFMINVTWDTDPVQCEAKKPSFQVYRNVGAIC